MDRPWQYDEMQQVGTDYTDVEAVKEYDARMWKLRNLQHEITDVVLNLELEEGHTVLELGTGTGDLAIGMAKYCKSVYATDVSPVMLEYAQGKAKTQGIDNVVFCHAGFLTFKHQGALLDAAVSQLALHHLPDFWKLVGLRRVSSFLKEGGKFYLRDIVYPSGIEDYEVFFRDWVSRTGQLAGRDVAWDTETHIRSEYSTLDWIMEGLLKAADLTIDSVRRPEPFMAIYVCTKRSSSCKPF